MTEPIAPIEISDQFPNDQDIINDLIGKVNQMLQDNVGNFYAGNDVIIPDTSSNRFTNTPELKNWWFLFDTDVKSAFENAGWVITQTQAEDQPAGVIAKYRFDLL